MPLTCLTDIPPKFHASFLSPPLKLHMHITIIFLEMYSQNNNSDQIITMYSYSEHCKMYKEKWTRYKLYILFFSKTTVQTFFPSISI